MAAPKLPESLVQLAQDLPFTLTKEQALEVLHMSERTFTRMVASGEIKIVKSSPGRSGRVTVPRGEIIRWMAGRIT